MPYAVRRTYIANLTFVLDTNHILINDAIEQKFIEISTRYAAFDDMSTDEKLAEIANLIENLLKKNNGSFVPLDYASICDTFITDDMIKAYRKKLQCFRHSSEDSLAERKSISEEQKKFLVDYGLTIIKVIHEIAS